MGKIAAGNAMLAAEVDHAVRRRMMRGEPGGTAAATLARHDGWQVRDVVCTSGPDTRPFEERHSSVSVAVVVAGTFQYRSGNTRDLLTPGSLLLGNEGECFECGHQHAAGDRCVVFHYDRSAFERIAFDAGVRRGSARRAFGLGRLPPLRALARFCGRTAAGLLGGSGTGWDEMAVDLAATAARLANGEPDGARPAPAGAERRVTASVRRIERDPGARWGLTGLAAEASLSPFHYLRSFRRVTGVTPHQFILRTRLRQAAARLATTQDRVLDVSLDAGFDDLSNFNHSFRAEFGASPTDYRRRWGVKIYGRVWERDGQVRAMPARVPRTSARGRG